MAQMNRTYVTGESAPPSRPWRWLAVPVALAVMGAEVLAQEIPDVLVNHDGLYAGADATEGPAGGTFTYRAKVKLNVGTSASNAVVIQQLPEGAIYQGRSFSPDAGTISCTGLPSAGTVLTASNNTSRCTIATLGTTFKWIDYNVILPSVASDWTATASAELPPPTGVADGDGGVNNTNLQRQFTTNEASDLGITLVSSAASVNNGDNYSYTITVTNHGPSEIPAAGRAQVTFEVPAGASVISQPGGPGWTCLPAAGGFPVTSGTYTCTLSGALAATGTPGTPMPSITVPVLATASGPIGAAASVEGFADATTRRPDGQLNNNTAAVIVTAAGDDWADMSLAKSVSPVQLDANTASSPVTYTLTPRFEAGGLVPADVRVEDVLPTGVTFDAFGALNANWNCSASTTTKVDCSWNGAYTGNPGTNMPPITFTASAAPPGGVGSAGSIVNTGRVSLPGQNEPNTTNNTATAVLGFSNTAQLSLSKSGPQRPAKKGEPFPYTLRVTNEGPMPIAAGTVITLTDTPTAPLKLVGMQTSSNWACPTGGTSFGTEGAQVQCQYTVPAGGMAVGASTSLVLNAQVDTITGEFTVFGNSATVGPVPERAGTAVSSSANVTVSDTQADLVVSKTVISGTAPLRTGDPITYRITVTNKAGSSQTAQAVRIEDMLRDLVTEHDGGGPTGTYPGGGFVSAVEGSFSGGTPVPGQTITCNAPTGEQNSRDRTLVCTASHLSPGQSVSVDVTIKPRVATASPADTGVTAYTNTASAFSPHIHDETPADNTSSVPIDMTPYTDLAVLKAVTPDPAAAGEPVSYTVTVQNLGPSSAQDVKLVDRLPANLILVGPATVPAQPAGGSCFHSTDATATSGDPLDGKQGGYLICTWTGALNKPANAVGQIAVQYKGRSVGTLPASTVLDNDVEVSTVTPESDYTNNNDDAQFTLKKAELDVQVQMRHSDDGLLLGEETEYTITIRHAQDSLSYATQVNMRDVFPATLIDSITGAKLNSSATFSYQGGLSVTPTATTKAGYTSGVTGATGGTAVDTSMCTAPSVGATSGALDCTFPLMAPGDTVTIKFKMRAESLPAGATTGTIFHDVRVSAAEEEYMSGYDAALNNATSDRTSTSNRAGPRPAVDLGLQKLGPTGRPQPGTTVMYTITVSNYGTDANSPAGSMIDTLPAGLSFVSANRDGASVSCTPAANVVTCPVPSLPRGGSTVFVLETEVNDPFDGSYPLINKARVSVSGDGDPDNDEDGTTTQPPPPASIPVDNPLALLALIFGVGLVARWQHGRRRH